MTSTAGNTTSATDTNAPTPRWPVVIFDLDGTLIDTIPLIVASYQHALTDVLGAEGARFGEAEIRSWIGKPLYAVFAQIAPKQADELFASYQEWNLAHTAELIGAFEGIEPLLSDLRAAGVTCGVATSKRRESAELALRLTDLTQVVPLTVTMEDTTAHKPEPEPLLAARAALGVPEGAATVYVGDAVMDVQAGQAAGFDTIAVTWGAGTQADLEASAPTQVVTTMAQLRAALGLSTQG